MSDDKSSWGTGWGQPDQPSDPDDQSAPQGQEGSDGGQQPPPPQQPDQGGWGQQTPPPQPDQGGWGQQTPPPQPDQGGWGQQPPPPQQPGYGQPTPPPPQPGSGQPAAPGGGFGQPAPPGGYGQPPSPPEWGQQPAFGAYGQPAGGVGQGPYSVGDAFSYGWRKFQDNVGTIILGLIGLVVVGFIINFVGGLLTQGLASIFVDPNNPTGAGIFLVLVATAVSSLFSFVVQILIQAGITRGALSLTYGRPIEIGTIFSADQLGQIAIASILVALMTVVGFILLFIPGLIVIFCTQYVVHFIIDKRMGAVDAIKASFSFTTSNVGPLLLFFLASFLAIIAGTIACLIGLLVAFPVVIIGQAYTYRVLQGEPVAP